MEQTGKPIPKPGFEHAYAIVRVDGVRKLSPTVDLQLTVNVKKIVWSEAEANSEVERLNGLKGDADSIYLCQITRVSLRPGDSAQASTPVVRQRDEPA